MSRVLGLGTMFFQHYPLYPDLARQFIASCRIFYGNPEDPRPDEGVLFFKMDGKRHSLRFIDINELFGFDRNGEHQHIPEDDTACQGIWPEITGKYRYVPAMAKHTDVRHPVLCLFVRLVSSTLLCKNEPGKMRKQKLMLLHYTVGHVFEYSKDFDMRHKIDFGAVFAHILEGLKKKGLAGTGRIEIVGSFLTPFFQYFRIDLEGRGRNDEPGRVDHKNLKKGDFLKGDWGKLYHGFLNTEGHLQLFALSSPLCSISTVGALCFQPLAGDTTKNAAYHQRRIRATVADSDVGPSSRPSHAPTPSSTFPPFEPPPPGCYENDPFKSWLVRVIKTGWGRCCCS